VITITEMTTGVDMSSELFFVASLHFISNLGVEDQVYAELKIT
jgi:hypothetical protein